MGARLGEKKKLKKKWTALLAGVLGAEEVTGHGGVSGGHHGEGGGGREGLLAGHDGRGNLLLFVGRGVKGEERGREWPRFSTKKRGSKKKEK